MEHQYFAEAEEGNMDHHQQLPEIIRKQQNKEKKRVRQEQVRVLESHFGFNNKLDPERKSQLAAELGVPPRQVAIWFQNKRAREKIQGLEVEHRGMQLQLESLLDENERLKEEAKSLKLELNKIKGAFSTSTSGDEVGSLVPRDFSGRDFYASPFGTAGLFVGHGGYEFFG